LQLKYFEDAFKEAGSKATHNWYAIMKSLGEVDGISDFETSDEERFAALNFR